MRFLLIRKTLNEKIIISSLLISLLFITGQKTYASSPISLTKQDKILILAPHPDDEAIGTGGVIQKAVELGIPIKVVYLTNGDNNELAFLVYEKHPIIARSGLLKMGEMRRQEAVEAMRSLGLQKSQLIFLGYPDFGTTEIFTKYWGDARPFKSMLTRVTSVPYKDSFTYGAPYKGESVLNDIKKVLFDFQPTKIFVTLPADTNVDHRAYYLFLQIALWDLDGKIPNTELYPYIIHVVGWPLPLGYHPELSLDIPEKLSGANLNWQIVDLDSNEIEKKKEAIGYYKSQNAYNPEYLCTFARKNELFGHFNDILLEENKDKIEWEEYVSQQRIVSHLADEEKHNRNIIQSVAYVQQNGKILIRLSVNHWESELSGINVFLIGYKKDEPFAKMPKIRLDINYGRFISVYDGLARIFVKDMIFSHANNVLLIELPLSALGDPEKILSNAKTYIADWPLEATEWRTLIVDRNKSTQ